MADGHQLGLGVSFGFASSNEGAWDPNQLSARELACAKVGTMGKEEPMWRPVSDVAMLTDVARQSVEFANEHLNTIRDAGPYQLDDATVARMLRVWNESSDMNQVFAQQGHRWRQELTSRSSAQAVAAYCALVDEERVLVDEILAITHKLETVTIERLLAKSDLEVALDALSDPWMRPPGFDEEGTRRVGRTDTP